MKPIFLIGYMGSGKTTLGRLLSHKLEVKFIDLDIYIENRYHDTVSNIFKKIGEDEFRKIEKSLLHEVSDFENVIISCGGGTPCFFDNIGYMNRRGLTIYLQASAECIFTRLTHPASRNKRPLVASKTDEELLKFIPEAIKSREDAYKQAKLVFNSESLESSTQIKESVDKLAQLIATTDRCNR